MSQLYPVFLKLHDKAVLIVGGGKLALQKWRTLRGTGARVTVVAPAIHRGLEGAGGRGELRLLRRAFRESDLAGASLVFAATDDRGLNRRVVSVAARAGITANAVDDPEHCDFYTPAVVRRGEMALAISTSGNFPGIGKALRETLEAWLPARDDAMLLEMFALRRAMKESSHASAVRSHALRQMLERFKQDYLNAALPASPEIPGAGRRPS